MVRLRHKDGTVTPISGQVAVEFLDSSGNLGAVILQKEGAAIHILTPGDPLFNTHLHVTKQRGSRVAVHEPAVPIRNGKPFELAKR